MGLVGVYRVAVFSAMLKFSWFFYLVFALGHQVLLLLPSQIMYFTPQGLNLNLYPICLSPTGKAVNHKLVFTKPYRLGRIDTSHIIVLADFNAGSVHAGTFCIFFKKYLIKARLPVGHQVL